MTFSSLAAYDLAVTFSIPEKIELGADTLGCVFSGSGHGVASALTPTTCANAGGSAVAGEVVANGGASELVLSFAKVEPGSEIQVAGCGMLKNNGDQVAEVTLASYAANITDNSDCGVVYVETNDYGADVTGDVVTTSNTGSRTTKDGRTDISEGEISSVEPVAGQEGTRVTIKGSSLFGGNEGVESVAVAGIPAFIDTQTDTEVVAVVFALPDD